MDKNKINYSKIIVVIVISFFIAQYSSREFFLSNSTQIRPNLDNYLANKFNNFFMEFNNFGKYFSSLNVGIMILIFVFIRRYI